MFGYTNVAQPFKGRTHRQMAAVPDPADLAIEDFGLADNLMVAGAALAGGGRRIVEPPDGRDRPFDALDVFARCVAEAAAILGAPPAAG